MSQQKKNWIRLFHFLTLVIGWQDFSILKPSLLHCTSSIMFPLIKSIKSFPARCGCRWIIIIMWYHDESIGSLRQYWLENNHNDVCSLERSASKWFIYSMITSLYPSMLRNRNDNTVYSGLHLCVASIHSSSEKPRSSPLVKTGVIHHHHPRCVGGDGFTDCIVVWLCV